MHDELMAKFDKVAQVENVGQGDLITSDPCCTTQEQSTCEISKPYHVQFLRNGPKPKTLTKTGRTDGQTDGQTDGRTDGQG